MKLNSFYMTKKEKVFIGIGIGLLMAVIFLLCIPISLVYQRERPGRIRLPLKVERQIQEETCGMGYNEVVEYCTKLTAKSLTFSDHCDEVTFVKPSAAHCVG